MTTCAILQPSFLPWRGYFHQIALADVFVFYDDVQYDKHGWRNRNRVKTANGGTWLTVPVGARGNVSGGRRIDEIEISWQQDWPAKHIATLRQAYSRAPHRDECLQLLDRAYACRPQLLATLTVGLTTSISARLGFTPSFLRSSELQIRGSDPTDRLVRILEHVGADTYISGPSARAYLDESSLDNAGIELIYMRYDYPPYEQLHPPFDGSLSIVDLLMMHGDDSARFIVGDT